MSLREPVLKTTIVAVSDGDKDRYSKLHRNTTSAKNEALINFCLPHLQLLRHTR
jgi:hypothetical protein